MNLFETMGIAGAIILIASACGVIALAVLYIVLWKKFHKFSKNYETFMKGSNGETLEDSIVTRFKEIDALHEITGKNTDNISHITEELKFAYQKFSIVKYDAFKEMGGKLSFSLCMLTDNDDGFVLTSVHSTNEGCYCYIKEIIKGESYVVLSEEEKKVLAQAKNRRSCLDD